MCHRSWRLERGGYDTARQAQGGKAQRLLPLTASQTAVSGVSIRLPLG